ncbi:MAG: flagellar basal body-associated FliL family protein [Alphaproteobacteria bacterium]|jgi:flagellar FliL protein|nr:flagellar basal body-associated FliL family protein [Alphaproteobacteria bacterium]
MAGGGKAAQKDGAQAAEGADGAAAEGKKKLPGKKLVLFVILPALLVLGGLGGAAMMLLKPGGEPHQEGERRAGKDKGKDHGKAKGENGEGEELGGGAFTVTQGEGVYFIALPEVLVNVSTSDGGAAHLKLRLTLEAADESAVLALEPAMPRVMDQFQTFLRELRTDDLAGSGGAYRVRLELMRRVNLVIAPERIDAVLVEEMLIQ